MVQRSVRTLMRPAAKLIIAAASFAPASTPLIHADDEDLRSPAG